MGRGKTHTKKKSTRSKGVGKDFSVAGKTPKKAHPEESVEDSPSDSFSFHGDTDGEGDSTAACNIKALHVVISTYMPLALTTDDHLKLPQPPDGATLTYPNFSGGGSMPETVSCTEKEADFIYPACLNSRKLVPSVAEVTTPPTSTATLERENEYCGQDLPMSPRMLVNLPFVPEQIQAQRPNATTAKISNAPEIPYGCNLDSNIPKLQTPTLNNPPPLKSWNSLFPTNRKDASCMKLKEQEYDITGSVHLNVEGLTMDDDLQQSLIGCFTSRQTRSLFFDERLES